MRFHSVLLLFILALVACDSNETVPRTNPRFSVTLIQEISEEGAIFQAEMFDYGGDEILQHGFAFAEVENPRIGYAEVVSQSGRPESIFQLTADFGLRKGRTYHVAAFIKTANGVIYSEATEFRSQGSKGFEFEKIEGGPKVYFGDTLTVFGKRLSAKLGDYSVQVNNLGARVVDIQENSFKFIVPDDIAFEPYDEEPVSLVLEIAVADVRLVLRPGISFSEPVFHKLSKEFKYSEDLYIKGEFLSGADAWIRSEGAYGNQQFLEIVRMTDTMMVFKHPNQIESLEPTFELHLRGKLHRLEGYVKIQKTEIEPNQKVLAGGNQSFKIKGTNFNVINPNENKLYFGIDGMDYSISQVTTDELQGYIHTYYAVPNPRFFPVYLYTANEQSKNSFTVENTSPYLAFKYLHTYPFDPSKQGRSVNWRDKAIWLVDGKITEVDPSKSVGKILKHVDIDQRNIASSFAVINKDVVYFAGKDAVISAEKSDFYSYDLLTGTLKKLPAIPSKASTPKSVFIDGGYLYFGGGFYFDNDNLHVKESYRFNLNSEKWESWAKEYKITPYWDFEITFTYQGQVYGLVNEITDSEEFKATRLMRFNRSILDWDEVARYPYLGFANGNVAMPIGNKVYAFIKEQAFEINMDTYALRKVQDVWMSGGFYGTPPLLFSSGDKIYVNNRGEYIMYEYDPAYFTY